MGICREVRLRLVGACGAAILLASGLVVSRLSVVSDDPQPYCQGEAGIEIFLLDYVPCKIADAFNRARRR